MTLNSNSLLRGRLTLAALSVLAVSIPLQAKVVSLNFAESVADNDAQNIDIDETYGVGDLFGIQTTVGNWSNTGANSLTSLQDKDGAATAVNYTGTQPAGKGAFGAPYADTPLNRGFVVYTGTANPVTTAFSGLNTTFPTGYYAVVYLTGFIGNTGASITNGTDTYYYQTPNPASLPDPLVQTTQTTDLGDGLNPEAQYAVFGSSGSPLTADAITFTIDALYGGGAGVGGVQLVGVNGNVVSLNIVLNTPNAQTVIGDFGLGTIFGVDTTVANWTNSNASSRTDLKDSDGVATTIDYSGTQPNDKATFNPAYDFTPLKAGYDVYSAGSAVLTATFTDVAENFPNGYYAIVYLTGYNSNDGAAITVGFDDIAIDSTLVNGSNEFVIDFTATPSSDYEVKKSTVLSGFSSLASQLIVTTDGSGVGQATVPSSELSDPKQFFNLEDSTDIFYYRNIASPVAPVTFVQTSQATDLGADLNPEAQYAIFGSDTSPLFADSITFTLTALYGGGAGLGGVQLVGLPDPGP
ncbi:hypothetical protein G0Q06_04320 [Puniceicoccales bacterium CK1056]|uniref:Uncharacterized protein n=1 Tax=Oceanipulchritudo coccoides TaxID=2706888 RepID=A0A6B2LYJ2_9BACT|nr:hypothetical protein [Oceanipulchritudo coccoides]NDV61668.1 hypothetical protein [Oceanipulchritudo coccoides]